MDASSLQNQFLIAMPGLQDPNFRHAVTLICSHDDDGALGLIVNRPAGIGLRGLLEQLEIPAEAVPESAELYWGGPVQTDRGFVLHEGPPRYASSLAVSDALTLTSSRDVLADIGAGRLPGRHLVAVGYAGWGAGQLEQELLDNAWLTAPADPDIVFSTPPAQRWQAAARLLGIDASQLSDGAGHA